MTGNAFSLAAAPLVPWLAIAALGAAGALVVAFGIVRGARGVLGAAPLIVGGAILSLLPHVAPGALTVAILVIGTGLSGSIYVVCAPMLGEFTPVSQRGAVLAHHAGGQRPDRVGERQLTVSCHVQQTVTLHSGDRLADRRAGLRKPLRYQRPQRDDPLLFKFEHRTEVHLRGVDKSMGSH